MGRIGDFIEKMIIKFKYRHSSLTITGQYFLRYCKEIVNGTLRDDQRVAAYEETINNAWGFLAREQIEKGLQPPTREEVAEIFVSTLDLFKK